MDRINGAGHIGRRFVAEDADLGRPPTLITDAWLNLVQEEIVNVILAAGGTLDGEQEDQLLQSINDLIQAASNAFVSVGGTADAITATYAPVIAALTNGMTVYVRAASANATATPTFTPDSGVIAAKTIVKGAGAALVAGDIAGAGHWIELQYDTPLDKWVLQNPATGVSVISGLQAGEVTFFARNTAPTGYMKANGAAVSRSTYADLFTAIGTTYGVGDGATTFNLPDLRGEFIRGWDDSRGIDSGRVFGSAQADDLKSHNHTFTAVQDVAGSRYPGGGVGNSQAGTTGSTGGTETRPRNIALLACIKY